jgi:hypothetical protein
MDVYGNTVTTNLFPDIIPFLDSSLSGYFSSVGYSIDITSSFFIPTTKEDIDNVIFSYPIDPLLLLPSNYEEYSYTQKELDDYALWKRLKLIPPYVLMSFDTIYLEQLHFLRTYIFDNFSDKDIILFDGLKYYSGYGGLVNIEDIDPLDYVIIKNFKILKSKQGGLDEFDEYGYDKSVYRLQFYIDVSEFVPFYGTYAGHLPVFDFPYSDEQFSFLPFGYRNILKSNVWNCPYNSKDNKYITELITSFKYPFENPMYSDNRYHHRRGLYPFVKFSKLLNTYSYNVVPKGTSVPDSIAVPLPNDKPLTTEYFVFNSEPLIYNSFHPEEFYICFKAGFNHDFYYSEDSTTAYLVQKPKYVIYRFRRKDYNLNPFDGSDAIFSNNLPILKPDYLEDLKYKQKNTCCLVKKQKNIKGI